MNAKELVESVSAEWEAANGNYRECWANGWPLAPT